MFFIWISLIHKSLINMEKTLMYNSKTAERLRQKVSRFSGVVSSGLCKPSRKFVSEMIYGIQAKQSVILSRIGRSLCESTSIKKIQERLSRQLSRKGLGESIQRSLLAHAADRIGEETLLIIDPSDITKRYARKMEGLGLVRDGSEGVIAEGYWTCQVVAANPYDKQSTPIYGHLYSIDAKDTDSENREMLRPLRMLCELAPGRGIWVIDRGGDRRKIIEPMLDEKARFIIRQRGDRHVVYRGKKVVVSDLAQNCPTFINEHVVKEYKSREKIYSLELGFRPVKLPGRNERLYLVVIRGFGEKPMMLLTSIEVSKSRKSLLKIINGYIRRWDVEEQIRFIKQMYDVENVRVLRYQSLQNLYVLMIAAAYFACAVLDSSAKLKLLAAKATTAAKRIFGVPDFRYYAVADGLAAIFGRYPGKIPKSRPPIPQQINLAIT